MRRNRAIIIGNLLFILAVVCYFTASPTLAYAIGAFGLILEIGGVVQLVKSNQSK